MSVAPLTSIWGLSLFSPEKLFTQFSTGFSLALRNSKHLAVVAAVMKTAV